MSKTLTLVSFNMTFTVWICDHCGQYVTTDYGYDEHDRPDDIDAAEAYMDHVERGQCDDVE